jgi:hypothetical protein
MLSACSKLSAWPNLLPLLLAIFRPSDILFSIIPAFFLSYIDTFFEFVPEPM